MDQMTVTEPAMQASPFHAGERQVQHLAGVREEAETRGRRMLTPGLNPQQAAFFNQLPFVVYSHADVSGQPWAGLVTGEPGFISVDAQRTGIYLDLRQTHSPTGLAGAVGDHIGLLGIDLSTRRRNRVNGNVRVADPDHLQVHIEQGYGNCPKYISPRDWPGHLFAQAYTRLDSEGLNPRALALASRTDTFFIATSSGPDDGDAGTGTSAWGADISHRGGDPGFLRHEDGQLLFDDFPGNNMFNTLGNLARNPKCAVLLLDFDSGDIAQLIASGRVEPHGDGRRVVLDVRHTRLHSPTGNSRPPSC